MTRNCAIIVSGGRGSRMKASKSKQFIELQGRAILSYTLEAFDKNSLIDEIILVLPEDEIELFKKTILSKEKINKLKAIVPGGIERQQSVYNGLRAITICDIVLIHDGARPFVTSRLIEEGIKYASLYGAAACGVTPKDTIKIIGEGGFSLSTPKRDTLCAVQTPQCFSYPLIKKAHEALIKSGEKVTDDTMAVEALGEKVYIYSGEYENIKITTPEDLVTAERLCSIYN